MLALIVATTLALYARTLDDWFQSDAILLLSGAKDLPLHVYVRRGSDFREFQPLRPYDYRALNSVTMDVMEMDAVGVVWLPGQDSNLQPSG